MYASTQGLLTQHLLRLRLGAASGGESVSSKLSKKLWASRSQSCGQITNYRRSVAFEQCRRPCSAQWIAAHGRRKRERASLQFRTWTDLKKRLDWNVSALRDVLCIFPLDPNYVVPFLVRRDSFYWVYKVSTTLCAEHAHNKRALGRKGAALIKWQWRLSCFAVMLQSHGWLRSSEQAFSLQKISPFSDFKMLAIPWHLFFPRITSSFLYTILI